MCTCNCIRGIFLCMFIQNIILVPKVSCLLKEPGYTYTHYIDIKDMKCSCVLVILDTLYEVHMCTCNTRYTV